jgi:hypothetical protein
LIESGRSPNVPVGFESFGIHPARGFIADDYQAVTALATEPVNQAAGVFMSQAAGFASAIAQNGPTRFFQVTRHKPNAGRDARAPFSGP